MVQKEVAELLQGRILVGHALRNDLKVTSYVLSSNWTIILTEFCCFIFFLCFPVFGTGIAVKSSKERCSRYIRVSTPLEVLSFAPFYLELTSNGPKT